jgi:hypothetical protein
VAKINLTYKNSFPILIRKEGKLLLIMFPQKQLRRNSMKKLKHFLLPMIMGIVVLSGCVTNAPNATQGTSFKQSEQIPVGKAVVYIYHSGGSNHRFFLQANGKDLTSLRKGLYYTYVTEPGMIEFTAKTMGTYSITLDVKAGQRYYLKGSVPPGFSPTPSLIQVSPEAGAQEIANYRLLPSP